jgi:hypothetical protein
VANYGAGYGTGCSANHGALDRIASYRGANSRTAQATNCRALFGTRARSQWNQYHQHD